VAGKVTAGLVEVTAVYHWVYDQCNLRADCQETRTSSETNTRNQVSDYFTLLILVTTSRIATSS